jgi:hypothetical protein
MALYRAKKEKKLTKVALVLGYPILIVGAILDFIVNISIFTLLFAELPKELLVTHRLTRHIKTGTGYRYKMAKWICENLLDHFDPSNTHCD